MKRVYIIHGWEGHPNEAWFPWMKRELESQGYEVYVPQMPNTEEPKIEEWVPFLRELVGPIDENTYFVGHSIGCQTIMRFLQELPDAVVGGIVFVGPWTHLKSLEDEETAAIAQPWLETPIKWNVLKKHNFVCVFSDNDQYVSLSEKEIFKEKLNADIILEQGKGHMGGEDHIHELPNALKALKKMM